MSQKSVLTLHSTVPVVVVRSSTIYTLSVLNSTLLLIIFWGFNIIFVNVFAGMKWKSTEFSCALPRRNDIPVCGEWKSWQRLTWEGKT